MMTGDDKSPAGAPSGDALAEENRLLRAELAAVAHDLRQPLRSLAGFSQLLIDDPPMGLTERQEDFLSRIHGAAVRMTQQIEGLALLQQAPDTEIACQTVGWNTLINDAWARVRDGIPGGETRLNLGTLPAVEADVPLMTVALVQVFNFLQRRHPRSPPAVAPLDGAGAGLRISVEGEPLDPSTAQRCFKLFYRDADASAPGVDLPLARHIARRHGGDCWLAVSGGTETCIALSVSGASNPGSES